MRVAFRFCVSASILAIALGSAHSAAQAQIVGGDPARFLNTDANGVDLVDGSFNITINEGSIGNGESALAMVRSFGISGWRDGYDSRLFRSTVSGQVQIKIGEGSTAVTFKKVSGVFVASNADGSTLTELGGGNAYTYTKADGSVLSFPARAVTAGPSNASSTICTASVTTSCFLLVGAYSKPNGLVTAVTWTISQYCQRSNVVVSCSDDSLPFTNITRGVRISRVSNNAGYAIDFTYLSNIFQPGSTIVNWYRRSTAVFKNTNQTSASWPTITYAYPTGTTTQTTDIGGRVWNFTYYSDNQTGTLSAVRRPGAAANSVSLSYASGAINSITAEGVTTGYNRVVVGNTATTTITNPDSTTKTAIADLGLSRITQFTDELGRITNYAYDTSSRPTETTLPEGNKVITAYDARGNVTSTTNRAKSGSGLADIVTTASYPATCTNIVTCNRPDWVRDAKGNQTDYTYNATHGGLLTATAPAATTGGVRPQTRYSYSAVGSVTLLTSVSSCQTTASCSGTADEAKTTTVYDANLLPTSITSASGDGAVSSATTYTYDILGNQITVDGPLSGSADTTRTLYDAARQPVGVIGPDPDGAGARLNRAVRYTYNLDGQVTLIEAGTTAGQSDTNWSAFAPLQSVASTYDANARKTTDKIQAGGTTYGLTQYSYDTLGRPDCAATRLNTAIYGSLPSSACTLGTAGSFGPDRISKTTYDAASQVTKTETGLGTTEVTSVSSTYSSNGKQATVADGLGNLTTYEYDGFDRLLKTRYPIAGSGTVSSTTDYEGLTYDANGNVTQRRLRDGNLIGMSYDALNRLTLKTTAHLTVDDQDITYTYDLLGRLTNAAKNSLNQTAFTWDALGRKTGESNYYYAMTSQYDAADRRTRLTWNDGFYVNYDYDATGAVTAIRENGATSGVGVLATYTYDNLGRRTTLSRGNATQTDYAYDPVSRLGTLTNNLGATAHDVTTTFSYNPASQISSSTRDNDAYAWNGHYNVDRPYAVNGLNQLTTAGATSLGYDGRGNLTSSGSNTYGYTSQNRLAAGPGGVSLFADSLERLDYISTAATLLAHDDSDLVAEYGYNGTVGPILRRYVYGPGTDEPLVWYEGSGTTDRRWLYTDERGSVTAVANASGNAIALNSYDEYGIPSSTNLGRFQYTGQAWLPELGMYYYKARIYSPTLGRFMQTDPIGYADGINWYNYVGGDPVNGTDPSGLTADEDSRKCLENCPADIVVTGQKPKPPKNPPPRVEIPRAPSTPTPPRTGGPTRAPCKEGDCRVPLPPPLPNPCTLANNFCGPKPPPPKPPKPKPPVNWKQVRTCLGAGGTFAAGVAFLPETVGGSFAAVIMGAAAIQQCGDS